MNIRWWEINLTKPDDATFKIVGICVIIVPISLGIVGLSKKGDIFNSLGLFGHRVFNAGVEEFREGPGQDICQLKYKTNCDLNQKTLPGGRR